MNPESTRLVRTCWQRVDALGPRAAVREAWTQVYGLVSKLMIDAARAGPLGQPH